MTNGNGKERAPFWLLLTWHDLTWWSLKKTFFKEEIVCFFHAWCVVYFLGMAILLLLLNVWSANKSNLELKLDTESYICVRSESFVQSSSSFTETHTIFIWLPLDSIRLQSDFHLTSISFPFNFHPTSIWLTSSFCQALRRFQITSHQLFYWVLHGFIWL